jgi:hypothetical protein
MHLPLLLLSPMAQSGHGVTQIVEVHMPPICAAISAVVDNDFIDVFLTA